MKDRILFSSGSATIGRDGKAALAAVAEVLRGGYGEFKPIAPNDTAEGRSQNRRIEIVLAPEDAPETAAAPAPPTGM